MTTLGYDRTTGIRLGALFGPAVFGVTAAGIALPTVIADLKIDPGAASWILTVHALALGIGTVLAGRIADSRGVRTSLFLGGVLLAAGAGLCLAAPGLPLLLTGRFLLAAGSGAMSASALAMVAGAPAEQRPRLLARFGGAMAVFIASATVVGGLVAQVISWRVTLILPALSLFAVPWCLGLATAPGSRRRIDPFGAVALGVTSAALLLLIQAAGLDLSMPLVGGLAATLMVAVGALAWSTKRPGAFVSVSLLRRPGYLRAIAIGMGVYGGLFAAMAAVPELLANAHNWTVVAIGVSLLPGAILGALLSRAAGPPTVVWITGMFALSLLLVAVLSGPASALVVAASMGGVAFAVTQVVVTGAVSAVLPVSERGTGLGIVNLGFFVGGAVGTAVYAALAGPLGAVWALGVVTVFPVSSAVAAGIGRARS
ncbi:putative MFS family arabinose efflux permease [Stackebrandtia endophytica]|uniref:Tetracycline resistance protein n=1 Tax=Stackebrandtia endophytica TaxID=1496996 RepID=A0A543ARV6_9ACTN|nr:MFS transporter [Stackebrandtia endophytica]TQL75245.1 putative MFS family arabinose efflux permease [Stackebrandtia endophytica]